MTRLTLGLVPERSTPLPPTLSYGRCANTWWTRRRTDRVSTGGTAGSPTARRRRLSSGSSSSRTRGTLDREEKGDGRRRTVIARTRPAAAIGGRHRGTEGRTGAGLPLETETTVEAGGTETVLQTAGGGLAERETETSERLGRRERI